MPVNRVVELLSRDQPVYYTGAHTGHILTREQGREDAASWADYINVGMEHGCFDMTGLDAYLDGMVAAGPTRSGHRTPAVIVEAPVEGTSEQIVRFNAWQFRQILARGVHGILLCQAETPDAVRAFVESCRYPINRHGVGAGLERGTRGVGSEASATAVWGCSRDDYIDRCDPWPLNPEGELLLGLKIESARGASNIEQILKVPGIGFAEMGPGDLALSLGHRQRPDPMPPEMAEIRERVKNACRENGIAFLSTCTLEDIEQRIDEGVRVVSGHDEAIAQKGRAYTQRQMPV